MRLTILSIITTIAVTLSGCSAAQRPFACSALRDGAFAVASYGCMRISEPAARDACTKAGLAASLLAYTTCLKESGSNVATLETGDPPCDAEEAVLADARAIIAEYEALEYAPGLGDDPRGSR